MQNFDDIYDAGNFRKVGHEIIELVAEYLLDSEKDSGAATLNWKDPGEQYAFWKKDFEQIGNDDPESLFKKVMSASINVHNKKYMGHQIAVVPPVMGLSALVLNILNNGMGVYEMGMAGNSMEKVVIENIASKVGYDQAASGFVVTGGTLGNLTALLAARAAISNVWEAGNGSEKYAIMVSSQAHYSVDRAARILGLGSEAVYKIPVNENFCVNTNELERVYAEAIKDNRKIICLIGCACTTATGSYDDLRALGTFCKSKNIWFHVDGAHGGAVIYNTAFKYLVDGIHLADSIIIDFHKMMMTPSLSTALLFKKGSDSYKTFSQHAAYLWQDEEHHDWYNSGMRTMECTKSMSILNVYTLFKIYGEEVFEKNIDVLFGLGATFSHMLTEHENFEMPVMPQSNIVCFRYLKEGTDLDKLNSFIRNELIQEGNFYIVQVTLNGNIYLRVSLMNPLTTAAELKQLLDYIGEKAVKFI